MSWLVKLGYLFSANDKTYFSKLVRDHEQYWNSQGVDSHVIQRVVREYLQRLPDVTIEVTTGRGYGDQATALRLGLELRSLGYRGLIKFKPEIVTVVRDYLNIQNEVPHPLIKIYEMLLGPVANHTDFLSQLKTKPIPLPELNIELWDVHSYSTQPSHPSPAKLKLLARSGLNALDSFYINSKSVPHAILCMNLFFYRQGSDRAGYQLYLPNQLFNYNYLSSSVTRWVFNELPENVYQLAERHLAQNHACLYQYLRQLISNTNTEDKFMLVYGLKYRTDLVEMIGRLYYVMQTAIPNPRARFHLLMFQNDVGSERFEKMIRELYRLMPTVLVLKTNNQFCQLLDPSNKFIISYLPGTLPMATFDSLMKKAVLTIYEGMNTAARLAGMTTTLAAIACPRQLLEIPTPAWLLSDAQNKLVDGICSSSLKNYNTTMYAEFINNPVSVLPLANECAFNNSLFNRLHLALYEAAILEKTAEANYHSSFLEMLNSTVVFYSSAFSLGFALEVITRLCENILPLFSQRQIAVLIMPIALALLNLDHDEAVDFITTSYLTTFMVLQVATQNPIMIIRHYAEKLLNLLIDFQGYSYSLILLLSQQGLASINNAELTSVFLRLLLNFGSMYAGEHCASNLINTATNRVGFFHRPAQISSPTQNNLLERTNKRLG